jgi:hypothetical protein
MAERGNDELASAVPERILRNRLANATGPKGDPMLRPEQIETHDVRRGAGGAAGVA